MRAMVLIKRLVVAVLLLVVAALGCVWFFLDPIVEAAVSHGGTEAAGVPVKLETADVSLTASTVRLGGFSIANPQGWSERPFFALREGGLKLRDSTVFSDAIEIETLDLSGIELSLERSASGSNWDQILANLQRTAQSQPAPEAPAESGPTRALRAKLIAIRDVHVTVEINGVPWVSGKKELIVPLVEVRDFKSDGTMTEITGALLSALLRAVLDAALTQGTDWLPKEITKDLGVDLKALRKALDEPGLVPELLDNGKQLLQGVESLFDNKKR
jgi:hypothetical protein